MFVIKRFMRKSTEEKAMILFCVAVYFGLIKGLDYALTVVGVWGGGSL